MECRITPPAINTRRGLCCKTFYSAVIALIALFSNISSAKAVHWGYLYCDGIPNTGATYYDTAVYCHGQMIRPAGDTGATLLQLGVHWGGGSASLTGLGVVLSTPFSCTLNDPIGRLVNCFGQVPLGGYTNFSTLVRVQGGCGSYALMNANMAHVYLVNVGYPNFAIHVPACPPPPPTPQCRNGVDDDGDGLTDTADPGCGGNPDDNTEGDATAQCQDGVDNDADGATDFGNDFSCSSGTDLDETNPRAQCQDGGDNDGDQLIDNADPGCSGTQDNDESNATSQCQDGVDNDADGATDFPNDFSCSSKTDNDETNPKSQCQDGTDNDTDGLIDLADPGCVNKQDNNESDGTTQCQDGLDNDSDGARDYPADFSCSSATDNDETNPKSQCQDGLDNDTDGLVDLNDPGCANAQDNNEGDKTSQCQDGLDNDNDGAIDFPADFGCSSRADNDESNPKARCQDGTDNDNDGLIDLLDPGCANSQDDDESNAPTNPSTKPECSDGIDNDGDAAIDLNDFSCGGDPNKNSEALPKAQCQDGIDNDNDGKIDLADTNCQSPQFNNEGSGAPSCIDEITTGINSELDEIALQLAAMANAAAAQVAKDAKKVVGVSAASVRRDVQRTRAYAQKQLVEANELRLRIPTISRTCPNLPSECRQVDNAPTIGALHLNYVNSGDAVARFYNRSGFNLGLATKTKTYRTKIRQARALVAAGHAALEKLPPVAVSCTQ